jgi:hypothetical protein
MVYIQEKRRRRRKRRETTIERLSQKQTPDDLSSKLRQYDLYRYLLLRINLMYID